MRKQTIKNQRNIDLAKIHIAKKQLGMDDVVYRDMLMNVAGVSSAADLRARAKINSHFHGEIE